MLLFRIGPRHLFLRTKNINEVTNFLVTSLKGEIIDFWQGFEKASENSTLCYITDIDHEKTYVEDAKKIVLINDASSPILCSIISSHISKLLQKVDMGPATIVMRTAGDEQKLADRLKEIFGGREVDWIEGIGIGEKDDTMIAFTRKVLNEPVSDFLDTKLLIAKPIREVQNKLRLEGLRLITQNLDDSQWYELRINIYDSYGNYYEHYERLMFVLSKLEMGMVLGESWTKDFGVILYSVMTYQVRLFTFHTPIEIKKIMMALEFTVEGSRLVDLDLYYKNKKVYWYEVNKNRGKGKTKADEAKVYREDLYKKLKQEDIRTLEAMEKSI
ncbi:MAG TPA: hypothetical protein PKY98_04940, partial [Sedimentibacter sp.]|nr:hypothetical protein [Sedimentibacter sp.]